MCHVRGAWAVNSKWLYYDRSGYFLTKVVIFLLCMVIYVTGGFGNMQVMVDMYSCANCDFCTPTVPKWDGGSRERGHVPPARCMDG